MNQFQHVIQQDVKKTQQLQKKYYEPTDQMIKRDQELVKV